MATGFTVSGSNPNSGTGIAVTVTGTPSGTLTWLLGRTPVLSEAVPVTPSAVVGSVYTIPVPRNAAWYVWATDAVGTVDEPAFAWSGLSPDSDLNACANALTSILSANRPALDAALQEYFPSATMKAIIYGSATQVREYPSLVVRKPRQTVEWASIPMGRDVRFTLEIHLYLAHEDNETILSDVAGVVGRVLEILNQPAYESLELSNGLVVCYGEATVGEADDVQITDGVFMAIGTVLWSCRAIKFDSFSGN